jgi:hypothetical protein
MHTCKNCSFEFSGNYCNNCGQKYNVPAFTFKHIFDEAFHAVTHADKSFIAFAQKLVINPGKLSYEYIIERKRKKYFNPFTFFLLINAFNALATGIMLDTKEKLFHANNSYGHIFNVYSKFLSLATIPFIALGMWIIHLRKPRIIFSEYTVFAMMLYSLYNIVEAVSNMFNYLLTASFHKDINIEDNILYLVLLIVYMAYADHAFHKQKANNYWWKNVLVGICFFVAVIGVQLFIIYAVFNDFKGLGIFNMYGININTTGHS